MAKIENAEYDDMTDEEVRAVRRKMDDDTGRTDETTDTDGDDGDGSGFAPPPEEVA